MPAGSDLPVTFRPRGVRIAAVVFGGDLGQAYLGTQGDIWDGQKDMALALAGTTIVLVALAAAGRLPTRR